MTTRGHRGRAKGEKSDTKTLHPALDLASLGESAEIGIAKELAELLAAATLVDIRARYAVGGRILAMEFDPRTGARTKRLDALARRLGRSGKLLYQCALVHASFTPKELEEWLAARDVHGGPMSWSHVVAAVSVRGARRRRLLTSWIADSTGVRAFKISRDAQSIDVTNREPSGSRK